MRILVLTFALTLLASCGFEPVHARRTGTTEETVSGLESVEVRVYDRKRMSQLFKAELEDQLNPDYARAPKRYILTVSLSELIYGSFVNPDGTASRNNVYFNSSYSLESVDKKTKPLTGTLSRYSSYNVSERADYATYVAEQDARKRGVIELAKAYKLRLAGLLSELEKQP